MKKVLIFIAVIGCLFFPIKRVMAENKVNIYFFHGDGCGYCEDEKKWFGTLKNNNKNIEIFEYEVWYNDENKTLMEKVKLSLNVKSKGVPFTIIGDQYYLGFNESISKELEEKIREYSKHSYIDKIGVLLGKIDNEEQGAELEAREETNEKEDKIALETAKKDISKRLWIPLTIVGSVSIVCILIVSLMSYRNKKRKNV